MSSPASSPSQSVQLLVTRQGQAEQGLCLPLGELARQASFLSEQDTCFLLLLHVVIYTIVRHCLFMKVSWQLLDSGSCVRWHISSRKMGGLGTGHPDKCRYFFRIIIRLCSVCDEKQHKQSVGAYDFYGPEVKDAAGVHPRFLEPCSSLPQGNSPSVQAPSSNCFRLLYF